MSSSSGSGVGFVPPGNGNALQVLSDQVATKVRGDDTAGSFSLFEIATPAGSAVPFHRHDWDETYYVLEGDLEFELADSVVHAARGSLFRVRGGTPHGMRNATAAPARFLLWAAPAGLEHFFEDLDRAAREVGFGMEKIVAVAGKHGIELVPPPSAA